MIWRSRRERLFGLGFLGMCYFSSMYATKLAGSPFSVKGIFRNNNISGLFRNFAEEGA